MVGGSRHLLQPMLQFVTFRFMRLFSAGQRPKKKQKKHIQLMTAHGFFLFSFLGLIWGAGEPLAMLPKASSPYRLAVWLISGNFTWVPLPPHRRVVHNKVMIKIKCVCRLGRGLPSHLYIIYSSSSLQIPIPNEISIRNPYAPTTSILRGGKCYMLYIFWQLYY